MGELLKDKIAIITGAAMGNGEGIAKAMAREGATVCGWDMADQIVKTMDRLCTSGYRAVPFKVNVSDDRQVTQTVKDIRARFLKVDVLVNNAGIYPIAPFLDMSAELRDRVWSINMKGPWNCIKAVLPTMIEQKSGKIINISSVTGPKVVTPGLTAYAMSKGAISAMTRSLALELAPYGINVNAILPGVIDTPGLRTIASEAGDDPDEMAAKVGKTIPWGRMGTIDEIGGPAVFLASEYSSYITGVELVVDGGNMLPELRAEL